MAKTKIGGTMHGAVISLVLLLASTAGAAAQQAPANAPLTDSQKLGRRLYTQSCLVCHARPHITSGLYGPALSRESAGGQADVMRSFIAEGTPRMPAFKYQFRPDEIDAIVQYLKIVPKPTAGAGSGGTSGPVD